VGRSVLYKIGQWKRDPELGADIAVWPFHNRCGGRGGAGAGRGGAGWAGRRLRAPDLLLPGAAQAGLQAYVCCTLSSGVVAPCQTWQPSTQLSRTTGTTLSTPPNPRTHTPTPPCRSFKGEHEVVFTHPSGKQGVPYEGPSPVEY
jgi:hypothetical protein